MSKDNFEKNPDPVGRLSSPTHKGEAHEWLLSRRAFIGHAISLGATAAMIQLPAVLTKHGWLEAARAAQSDIHETLNGLIAFFVPGPDPYSVAQGVSTGELGGVNANVTDALINTLDLAQPPLSITAATVLNNVALGVNPNSKDGPFSSPFANLLFQEKVKVFQILGAESQLAPLASLLALAVAFLSYSEAGVFDSGKLTDWPVGWTISGYQGVSRGHDEFRGYFQNRRKVLRKADDKRREDHA